MKNVAKKKATDIIKEKREKNTEGYPLYPPSDDIMNHEKKLTLNEELDDVETGKKVKPLKSGIKAKRNADDESTVSKEERELLGLDDMNDDMNKPRSDDDYINDRGLDVPGSELDDDAEDTGSEDEENNSYSIGGDRHEDLDENGSEKEDR